MRQKYRTTCFADLPLEYQHSLEDDPEWRENVVGFRLAHDPVDRVSQGSGCIMHPEVARTSTSSNTAATAGFRNLGFRLAADGGTG